MIGVSTALKYQRSRGRGKNIRKVVKISSETENFINMLRLKYFQDNLGKIDSKTKKENKL